MKDTTSDPFPGAVMVKLPSPFEVVPTCEPSTITVAPATGFPSGPVTVPEICLLWASESNIPPPNKAINDSRIFLTISVNLIVFFKIKSSQAKV